MLKGLRPKSEFATSIATLLTGTAVAQAIPIAATPILTRLYTPEDFGILALFMAVTTLLGSIANGRYELAIMLPAEDDDAINVAALCVVIASVFSLLLLVVVTLFNEQLAELLGNSEVAFWLYFVPITVWGTGFFNALNYLNTRSKNYKDIATTRVFKSIILVSINLVYGMIKSGAAGLILGQIASQLFANFKLLRNGLEKFDINKIQLPTVIKLLKRYIDFPKFSMWAVLANNLSSSLLNILISTAYGVATLGHFSIAQKLLGMPSTVIGNAISQVYFQGAVNEKNKTGNSARIFKKTLFILLLASSVIFVPLYFILPELFSLVLGEKWYLAGEFASLLIPFYFVRFVSSSVSISVSVFEKNNVALGVNLIVALLTIFVFFVSNLLGFEFIKFLEAYSFILAMTYGVFIYLYWKIVK